MRYSRQVRILTVAAGIALSAIGSSPMVAVAELPVTIQESIEGAELVRRLETTDGQVLEVYRTPEGREVSLTYKPDGRIEMVGGVEHRPPRQRPELGAEMDEGSALNEAAVAAYEHLQALMAPNVDFEIEATAREAITPEGFAAQPLDAWMTRQPERRLDILARVHSFTDQGRFLFGRSIYDASWQSGEAAPVYPREIETLADLLQSSADRNGTLAWYDILEAVPLQVRARLDDGEIEYLVLALRGRRAGEPEANHRLILLDFIAPGMTMAQREDAPPLTKDDLVDLPRFALLDLQRLYGLKLP